MNEDFLKNHCELLDFYMCFNLLQSLLLLLLLLLINAQNFLYFGHGSLCKLFLCCFDMTLVVFDIVFLSVMAGFMLWMACSRCGIGHFSKRPVFSCCYFVSFFSQNTNDNLETTLCTHHRVLIITIILKRVNIPKQTSNSQPSDFVSFSSWNLILIPQLLHGLILMTYIFTFESMLLIILS